MERSLRLYTGRQRILTNTYTTALTTKQVARRALFNRTYSIITNKDNLKSDSHLPKKTLFICFNDGPSKMMKNAFYFILKALSVLKLFKFLS